MDGIPHLSFLDDILILVSNPDSIESIANCETPAEILTHIDRLLAQAEEA